MLLKVTENFAKLIGNLAISSYFKPNSAKFVKNHGNFVTSTNNCMPFKRCLSPLFYT